MPEHATVNRSMLCSALIGSVLALGGCVSSPSIDEIEALSAPHSRPNAPAVFDRRSEFASRFCTLYDQRQSDGLVSDGLDATAVNDIDGAVCQEWLLFEDDDVADADDVSKPSRLSLDLRIIFIPGAFNDCLSEAGEPFSRVLDDPLFDGVEVVTVPLSGRSSSQLNAESLQHLLPNILSKPLESKPTSLPTRTVLIAYSKGVADALLALSQSHLQARSQAQLQAQSQAQTDGLSLGRSPSFIDDIDAFVSVAGSVGGSPLADDYGGLYDFLLSRASLGDCEAGDGGVVDSLETEARQTLMTQYPPPEDIPYYSVVAVASDVTIARGLRPAWRQLRKYDPISDGQVLAVDALVPNSNLLAYVHADHWGAIIEPEKEYPWLVSRASSQRFPQAVLLRSIIDQVLADLDRDQNGVSDAAASVLPPDQ